MPPPLSAFATRSGLFALIAGAIAIGFAPIFVRLSEAGPSATAFWRLALALPLLLLWSRSTARQAQQTSRKPHSGANWLAMTAGLCFAADLILWHHSIHFTSIANATLLTNLSVVFVPLLVWVLYRKRVSRRFALAVVIALGGTVMLVGKNADLSMQTLRGDVLAIASAIFYSAYILCMQASLQRGMSTVRTMTLSCLAGALTILPVALLSKEVIIPETLSAWGILIGLAAISHFGGQSLITYALAKLPAAFVSLGLLLQPATAALIAWLWLGEILGTGQIIGAVLLIIGIVLARQQKTGTEQPAD